MAKTWSRYPVAMPTWAAKVRLLSLPPLLLARLSEQFSSIYSPNLRTNEPAKKTKLFKCNQETEWYWSSRMNYKMFHSTEFYFFHGTQYSVLSTCLLYWIYLWMKVCVDKSTGSFMYLVTVSFYRKNVCKLYIIIIISIEVFSQNAFQMWPWNMVVELITIAEYFVEIKLFE